MSIPPPPEGGGIHDTFQMTNDLIAAAEDATTLAQKLIRLAEQQERTVLPVDPDALAQRLADVFAEIAESAVVHVDVSDTEAVELDGNFDLVDVARRLLGLPDHGVCNECGGIDGEHRIVTRTVLGYEDATSLHWCRLDTNSSDTDKARRVGEALKEYLAGSQS